MENSEVGFICTLQSSHQYAGRERPWVAHSPPEDRVTAAQSRAAEATGFITAVRGDKDVVLAAQPP